MINQTNLKFYRKDNDVIISKKYLINYLYFLLDKIDPVYLKEISNSINRFIDNINKGGYINE